MGMEEGTCWDADWVLYGNQFDNKFHIKKKERKMVEMEKHYIKKTKQRVPIVTRTL